MTELSFKLFGQQGVINPTLSPWSYAINDPSRQGNRWALMFYNSKTRRFSTKQGSSFDGGWRWFDEHEGLAIAIYNVMLNPQAVAYLKHTDIEDTRLQAETLLNFTKVEVIVEHQYFDSLAWVQDMIHAMYLQARAEVFDGPFL